MNNLNKVPLRIRLINLYALLFILCGSIIIGSVVFLKVLEYLLQTPIQDGNNLFKALEANPQASHYLYVAQALTALTSFILIPLIVIFLIWPDLKVIFQKPKEHFPELLGLALLLTLASFPLIAILADLNKSLLDFSGEYQALEQWMKNYEEEAGKLTEYLAYYNNFSEFFWGLLVIAVLPAVGEELLFRGVIQKQLEKTLLNPHAAIWITGFIFSFIHFQFYGFLPRMFLGVLFGYLFYWSGSIWIPMIMHFTNNAATFLGLNYYKQKKITVDLESTKDLSPWTIAISVLIFIFLLYSFYRLLDKKNIRSSQL